MAKVSVYKLIDADTNKVVSTNIHRPSATEKLQTAVAAGKNYKLIIK